MSKLSKAEERAAKIQKDRRNYLNKPHTPKSRTVPRVGEVSREVQKKADAAGKAYAKKQGSGAKPKAQPKGEGGDAQKTTVTTGKTAAASKKGS